MVHEIRQLIETLSSFTDCRCSRHVHTKFIVAVLQPSAIRVAEAMLTTHAHTTIALDPNARPSLMRESHNMRSRIELTLSYANVSESQRCLIIWRKCRPNADTAIIVGWLASPLLLHANHSRWRRRSRRRCERNRRDRKRCDRMNCSDQRSRHRQLFPVRPHLRLTRRHGRAGAIVKS